MINKPETKQYTSIDIVRKFVGGLVSSADTQHDKIVSANIPVAGEIILSLVDDLVVNIVNECVKLYYSSNKIAFESRTILLEIKELIDYALETDLKEIKL